MSLCTPRLSVCVPMPDGSLEITRTLSALASQTIREQMELVLVVPDGAEAGTAESMGGFAAVHTVRVVGKHRSGSLRAIGVRDARAPIVAFAEDHCFPDAAWAEETLRVFDSTPGAVGVGPSFENANPSTAASWVHYLMSHGAYASHRETAYQSGTAWHNTAYRREALLAYGDRLGPLLDVEGLLQADLRARGGQFVQSAEASVAHLNFSRLGAMLEETAVSGRVFGASRAEGWSAARKAARALVMPLVPVARYWTVRREARRSGHAHEIGGRALPVLLTSLVVSAAGEGIGCVFGPGQAGERKFDMETRRHRFMSAADTARCDPRQAR